MSPLRPAHAVMAEQCTGRGRDAVVCAAAPLAALAGVDAFRAGGNAYDAAVAGALGGTALPPPRRGVAAPPGRDRAPAAQVRLRRRLGGGRRQRGRAEPGGSAGDRWRAASP